MSTNDRTTQRLILQDNHGLWAIHSTSETIYFVDLDEGLLLRAPGPNSPRQPGSDGRWLPLLAVVSSEDVGVVTVGRRHRWDMDGGADVIWWIQRAVTVIERLGPNERPTGQPTIRNADARPFDTAPDKDAPGDRDDGVSR